MKMFLDSQVVTPSPAKWNSNDLIIGGGEKHSGTESYIDDFRIYNVSLSESYISNLAHKAFGPLSTSFARLGERLPVDDRLGSETVKE
jgi:hypothetical protein